MKDIPAFPLEIIYTQENEKFNGMTLRDYFATHAMQGIMTDPNLDMDSSKVAQLSYQMADAMMKARPDGL